MKIRKITAADLTLGMLVPWNVYGENGVLLARKGHMIASANQLDYLIERGSFEDPGEPKPEVREPDSALRKLDAAYLESHTLLQAVALGMAPPGLRRKLEDVVTLITAAVELSTDIATASILHNQRQASYPARHSVNTAIVALVMAKARERSPQETMTVMLAALTMNVGMLDHHQRWHDSHAALDATDRARMLAHPEHSVRLLRQAGIADEAWLDCVLQHHENEDGTGYPLGKSGAQIAPLSKLIAQADRYCARVSERTYRKTMTPNAALRDILLESRSTLHSSLASILVRELGIYPIGTYVRLINGEIAVVSRRGLQSTTPHVESVIGPRGAPLEVFLKRDTRGDLHGIREVLTNAQVAAMQASPLRMEQVWGRAAAH